MKRNDITSNYIDLEHKAKGDEENDNGETKKQDLDGNIRNKATVVQKQPNRSKVKKRVGVSAIAQQQENTQQLINLGLRGVAQQLSMARFIQNTPVNTIPQWQLD
ncbi:hypothetical protein, partial [Brevibacillus porteri]|uniref:hypothetical protein n=1 Tax=Brevibacillus porteri TaxID=2126350 RepID=UPI003D1EFFE7